MEPSFDFYRALRELVEQVPEGRVTTPLSLARALGDGRAARAVSEALNRKEVRGAAGKVVRNPGRDAEVFRDFESDRPLKRLVELQKEMSRRVVREDRLEHYEIVAGVDASYVGDAAYAACVVLDDRYRLLESASARVVVRFPYISGYLSFREASAVEAAARRVSGFDVLMVNGHGVAHPRGCGLASHVGLDLDVAAIGVARRRLVGDVGDALDDWAPLIYGGSVVGGRLTVGGRSPLYVSVGHSITLETSREVVRRMSAGRRLPEPLRQAHRLAGDLGRRGS